MSHTHGTWQRVKRLSVAGIVMSCLLATLLATAATPLTAQATSTLQGSKTLPNGSASGLEDDATQWGIFYDQGSGQGQIVNVTKPSKDSDKSLEISLISGTPYLGIHAYRNLAPADTAITFQVNFAFYFTTTQPIQALEFTMNKWVNNTRFEWALQWENIGMGVPPPQWRLWTGSQWQPIGVTQQLSTNRWHHLQIKGNIVNQQVHYISFKSDSLSVSLGQTFAPVSEQGDKLAVAVQLDGDSVPDPYNVFVDQVNLTWS